MRAIIEIFLAIIFTTMVGNFASEIKKETILKVQKGLPKLSIFTEQLTRK